MLITGAASGIGRLMARMALDKGAPAVVIWDVNDEAIKSTVAEYSSLGKGKVFGFHADVSSPESIDKAYAATKVSAGHIGILINCAGIINNNKLFREQTDADIIRTVDINTKGAMFVTLRVVQDMVTRGSGHVCNVTSAAGMLAMPKMSLYTASKWAATGWSESMRLEFEREKSPVKVTTVAPYFIGTGMFDGIKSVFKIRKPEEVAAKTIRAIERNKKIVGIPFSYHFIRIMQGIIPFCIFDPVFGDAFGLYTVMDHFTGRKPKTLT